MLYYYNLFYEQNANGKLTKIVPKNMEQLISPVVLAHLIMGGGGGCYAGNLKLPDEIIRIYTNSFTKGEVELLSLAISSKLNIPTKVAHDRNNQYMLTISKSLLPVVRECVISHMHSSMYYKLGLKSDNLDSFNYNSIPRVKAI